MVKWHLDKRPDATFYDQPICTGVSSDICSLLFFTFFYVSLGNIGNKHCEEKRGTPDEEY